MEEARKADVLLAQGHCLGPLHGVPCTVKEGLGLRGAPHTLGSLRRVGQTASMSGTVVERLQQAGAIILGLGNMSEMALWPESNNLVYGRTSNPYGYGRTPGGSSGGDAALVAAGGVPFGIGTDGGGSIRIPAAYCGVFGHKPTGGTVPMTGHIPLHSAQFRSRPEAQRVAAYFATGPLTRSAKDLMPILRVISGADNLDQNARDKTLYDPASIELSKSRILVCSNPQLSGVRNVSASIQKAVNKAASYFADSKCEIVEWTSPRFKHAASMWISVVNDLSLREVVGDGCPISLISEIVRTAVGRRHHTAPSLLAACGDYITPFIRKKFILSEEMRRSLKCEIEAALGPNGLLIFPATPDVAGPHGSAMFHPMDIMYAALFNALKLPATSVPLGYDGNGLPLAVQLIGGHDKDHVTIAGALYLEEAIRRETLSV